MHSSSRREGDGGRHGMERIGENVSTKRWDVNVCQYNECGSCEVEPYDRAWTWPFTHIVMAFGDVEKHGLALGFVGFVHIVEVFGTTSCICLSITNNGINDSIPSLGKGVAVLMLLGCRLCADGTTQVFAPGRTAGYPSIIEARKEILWNPREGKQMFGDCYLGRLNSCKNLADRGLNHS